VKIKKNDIFSLVRKYQGNIFLKRLYKLSKWCTEAFYFIYKTLKMVTIITSCLLVIKL